MDRETKIKKLLYQSWYRGCKETDKILGVFARENLHNLSDAEIEEFEAILKENDVDIYNWLTGKQPVPLEIKNNSIFSKLLSN
ncbi:MAG: succinate dehydrogenase assembly factor 2 [Rickettsiales bacterium]|nr:succinate dehydrogenase assembly factor 2 [Rickettsiales bacterium]